MQLAEDTRVLTSEGVVLHVETANLPGLLTLDDYERLVRAALGVPGVCLSLGRRIKGLPVPDKSIFKVVRSGYGSPFWIDFQIAQSVLPAVLAGVGLLSVAAGDLEKHFVRISEFRKNESETQKNRSDTDEAGVRARKYEAEAAAAWATRDKLRLESQKLQIELETLRVIDANGKEAMNLRFDIAGLDAKARLAERIGDIAQAAERTVSISIADVSQALRGMAAAEDNPRLITVADAIDEQNSEAVDFAATLIEVVEAGLDVQVLPAQGSSPS